MQIIYNYFNKFSGFSGLSGLSRFLSFALKGVIVAVAPSA